MEHVVVLVAEVGDQLFDLGGRHPCAQKAMLILRHPLFLNNHALWSERVGVVLIVKLLGVPQVHLEDIALGPSAGWSFIVPASPSQSSTHRKPPFGRGWLMAHPYRLFASR